MFLNIHTHHLSNHSDVVELFYQFPLQWNDEATLFSTGIHPAYINSSSFTEEMNVIRQKSINQNFLAIGEIGLDKMCKTPFALQETIFKAQLEFATEKQLPVIIHSVRAYQEILAIRKNMKLKIPFIFHGFNKKKQLLSQIIAQNCYVSFGHSIFHSKSLQATLVQLLPNQFFLENDSSDISILEIYNFVANLRKITVEELKIQQAENWKNTLGYKV